MGLECDDVDLDVGVLTIRLTKFGKSRLVPLHPTTCTALRVYAARRDAHLGSHRGSTFFVAEQGVDTPHHEAQEICHWQVLPQTHQRKFRLGHDHRWGCQDQALRPR